jgi:hypothetical protein
VSGGAPPPDVVDLLVPLYGLYEFAILAILTPARRSQGAGRTFGC